MELRELRVSLALAEELDFGHAAARLHMNRSRVSHITNELEAKVAGRLNRCPEIAAFARSAADALGACDINGDDLISPKRPASAAT